MLYNPDIVVAPDYFVEMMKVYEEKGRRGRHGRTEADPVGASEVV